MRREGTTADDPQLWRLYHFTCWKGWLGIQEAGLIRVTESNIGSNSHGEPPYGEHYGPDVVWLTTHPTSEGCRLPRPGTALFPTSAGSFEYSRCEPEEDKTGVRLTVQIPEAECHPWTPWALKHGINRKWKARLEKRNCIPIWWRVIERPILSAEIVEVTLSDALFEKYGSPGTGPR